MRKPTIHYLSLRNIPEFEREKRRNPPSGQKQDYIISSLVDLGYKVNYVSFSESFNNKFYRAKKKKLNEKVTFFLTPNVPGRFRESFAFRWFYHIYSAKNIKKGDVLLIYHTNGMRNDLLKRLADKKGLKIIYEIEEIYAYAHEYVDKNRVKEEIDKLQIADSYFFNSESLCRQVNRKDLPYVIVEGYYKYSKIACDKFNDGKIHCVYGGIIDSVKGGAFRAVEAAKYLPENYVVHILGFGESCKLIQKIDEAKDNKCRVIFEGLKNGNDYISFLSKCDIGLSLMTMREDINNSAFPSKIILYLACGLRTVACRVDVLEKSKVREYIDFYEEDTPQSIATAILNVDFSINLNSKKIMTKLDQKFKEEIDFLIRGRNGNYS